MEIERMGSHQEGPAPCFNGTDRTASLYEPPKPVRVSYANSASEPDHRRCAFCKVGNPLEKIRRIAFRQGSDKDSVRCEVMIVMHVCETCGVQTVADGTDQIMDEAFERECRKLR